MLPAAALAKLDAMDEYDRMLAFGRVGSDYRMSAVEVEDQYNAWKRGDTVAPSTFSKEETGPVTPIWTVCKLYPRCFQISCSI